MKINFKKLTITAAAVIFIWFVSHYLLMMYPYLVDNYAKADLIVVFGNKVERTGMVSERLKRRLDKAVKLYAAGVSKKIIVSGATGVEGFNEPVVMKKYLLDHGIAGLDITIDEKGYNTFATVKNVKSMLAEEKMSDPEIIIVTDYYHMARARLAFNRAGFKKIGCARAEIAPETTDIKSVAREFAGYYYYMIRSYDQEKP